MEKPDIVISSRDYLNLICILQNKILGVCFRHIPSVHVDYRAIPKKETFKDKMLLKIYRYFYGMTDMVVAVSHGVAENFVNRYKYNANKVKVIYNPVYDPSMYKNDGVILNEDFFEEGIPVIIGVGRFTSQKNFKLLVEAFSEVVKVRNSKLILLGDGTLKRDIEGLVKRLKIEEKVWMPGFVSNPQAYIKKANLFVLSSDYEGFGNVLVEAMGTGITVVSTDCYSGPSEILQGGKYGILVEVGNVNELKEAILEGLSNPFDSDKIVNRAKDFSIEKAAAIYQKWF